MSMTKEEALLWLSSEAISLAYYRREAGGSFVLTPEAASAKTTEALSVLAPGPQQVEPAKAAEEVKPPDPITRVSIDEEHFRQAASVNVQSNGLIVSRTGDQYTIRDRRNAPYIGRLTFWYGGGSDSPAQNLWNCLYPKFQAGSYITKSTDNLRELIYIDASQVCRMEWDPREQVGAEEYGAGEYDL